MRVRKYKFFFVAHFSNARCHLLCNLHSDDNRISPRAEAGKDVVNAGFRSENVAQAASGGRWESSIEMSMIAGRQSLARANVSREGLDADGIE
jgi:hypothetical protein